MDATEHRDGEHEADGTDDDRGEATPGTSEDSGAPAAVVVFWRPGCGFCMSLRHGLRRAGLPVHEVNIWEDPRAAEAVRRITGGSETVPTVVIGDVQLVNPSARKVLAVVSERAPHLLAG